MTGKDYSNALKDALMQLELALEEQEQVESAILSLRKTVNALTILCEESGEEFNWRETASPRLKEVLESSITEDILRIVNAAPVPLTTTDINNEMDKVGGLEDQKNPLATINAVLNRLREQKKVRLVVTEGRNTWEKWQRPTPIKPNHEVGRR